MNNETFNNIVAALYAAKTPEELLRVAEVIKKFPNSKQKTDIAELYINRQEQLSQ